jgi:hypothetical protein
MQACSVPMHCQRAGPPSVLSGPASVQLQMIPAVPPRQFIQDVATSQSSPDSAVSGHSGMEKFVQTQTPPS